MHDLIGRIRSRLSEGAYSNEAAVSVGILMPLLNALGWDSADPDQVIPEFSSGRGRVDFALCGAARRPAVFIEVKGVGRSLEGDRQLFEYAFHEGVPLCVLTDGREWSFYLPSGQGNYEDRRVYRLQLDDRATEESVRILQRYLARQRVKSGDAFEDAQRDYRDVSGKREASRNIPQSWDELVAEPDDLLIELIADRTEARCGFRPTDDEVGRFLSALGGRRQQPSEPQVAQRLTAPKYHSSPREARREVGATRGSGIDYVVFGKARRVNNANRALVEILSELALKAPDKVELLARAVQGRSRNHIARTAAEIYPARPDLARADEFSPGWLVGLNIANREKIGIIRKACEVFGARFGTDVIVKLNNAE